MKDSTDLQALVGIAERIGYGVVIKEMRLQWAKALLRDGMGYHEAVSMTGVFPEDIEFYINEVKRSQDPLEPVPNQVPLEEVPPPVTPLKDYPSIPKTL